MTGQDAAERVVFVFVDGLGLGTSDPDVNPVAAARMPRITKLLDGHAPVADNAPLYGQNATLVGLDATLGVPGLPQSGTGHVALLTGVNAARSFGRHFGPWPPTALRPLLARRSILARAIDAGLRVAFANAYPELVVRALQTRFGSPGPAAADALMPGGTGKGDALVPGRPRKDDAFLPGRPGKDDAPGGRTAQVPSRRGRPRLPLPRAGPPLAAVAAGLLVRHAPELARGEAVASEIVNDGWRERLGHRELPRISPGEAGANLARIAERHDLTLFAHYTLDHIGHRGGHADAVAALERVDEFLGGLLDHLPDGAIVLVASDHGNIEDVRAGHTRNPALGLLVGPGVRDAGARLRTLCDVTPVLLDLLGVPALEPEHPTHGSDPSDLPDPEHHARQDERE